MESILLQPVNADTFKGLGASLRRLGLHLHDHIVPHARNNYRPHTLSARALMLYATLLVSVKVSVIALSVLGPATLADASAITTANVFNLTNTSRSESGLSALTWNDALARAAQAKADDMLAKGYFSHTSPDGRLPWDFITVQGYNYLTAGENLAEGFVEAETTEEAWMNSPGHRANILNKNFQEIGVGISDGKYQGQRTIFVVQMFGTPMEQPIKILDTPTQVKTTVTSPTDKTSDPVAQPVATAPVKVVERPVTPSSTPVVVDEKLAAPAQPTPLGISNARVLVNGDQVNIVAETKGDAVKVLAVFGETAVSMDPKPNNIWEGQTKLSSVNSSKIIVQAYDLRGNSVQTEIASFAPSVQASFNPHAAVKGESIQLFGRPIDLRGTEAKFYLLFIATILTLLVIAIAVKKHVQHVGLVANSAFVVVLAVLFWVR